MQTPGNTLSSQPSTSAAGHAQPEAVESANANTKIAAGRAQATMTANEMEKLMTAHPLAVTRAESVTASLVLAYTLYKETKSTEDLQDMMEMVRRAGSDHQYGQDTETEGEAGFYDFETPLTIENVGLLAQQLKGAYPTMPDLNPKVIVLAHEALCSEDQDSGVKRGNKLRYGALGLFLEHFHDMVGPEDKDAAKISAAIQLGFEAVEISNRYRNSYMPPALLNDKAQLPGNMAQLLVQITSSTIKSLEGMEKDIQNIATAVAEQHGGTLKHASFQDLMMKLGSAVDVAAVQAYHEQLGGFLAALAFSRAMRAPLDTIRNLRRYHIHAQRVVEGYVTSKEETRE